MLVLLAIGLILRAGLLFVYLGTHGWKGEVWEYETLALNLLDGKGFTFEFQNTTYRSYVAPLFPFVCYLIHLFGGSSHIPYFIFHLSIATAAIWLSYRIASRWLGSDTGFLAALLVSVEPGLVVYNSYKIDVVTLAIFLLLCLIELFYWLTVTQDWRLAVCWGGLVGLGILTRFDLIAALVLLAVWLLFDRHRFPQTVKLISVALLVALCTVTPWVVRNYMVHGRFIFITTTWPQQLWLGNNPRSTGSAMGLDAQGLFDHAPLEFREKVLSSNELEQAEAFKAEVWRFIAKDPSAFLWLTLRKAAYFWWFTPTYGLYYQDLVPKSLRVLYQILYACLLLLAMWGCLNVFSQGTPECRRFGLYVLSLMLVIAAIHSLTFVEGRHRLLATPFLLMFSAYGLNQRRVSTGACLLRPIE